MPAVDAGTTPADDSIERVIAGWAVTRPELDVSPIAIIARVFRLCAELQPRLDVVLHRHGVRSGDFAVLATLIRLDEARLSQSRLGGELGLTAGTISVRLDRLERRGLIARERGAEDLRQTLVGLTKAGRALFEAAVEDHLANSRALVSALDTNERELAAGLLAKLLESLERQPGRPSPRTRGTSKPNRKKEEAHAGRNRRRGQNRRQRGGPARAVGT